MTDQPTPTLIECPVCQGNGETAVPGTYGPTISPENLELIPCWMCAGAGEVTPAAVEEYDDHIASIADGSW